MVTHPRWSFFYGRHRKSLPKPEKKTVCRSQKMVERRLDRANRSPLYALWLWNVFGRK